jgi:hypothetical protein
MDGLQRAIIAGAVGKAKKCEARRNAAHRIGRGRDALPSRQACAARLVGALRPEDLVGEALTLKAAQIAMGLGMVADLKQRIGDQLMRALLVRAQPFATGEKGGLDALLAQVVDDGPVVARDLSRLLAQIEGQGDELAIGGELDAADHAFGGGNGGKACERLWGGASRRRCLFSTPSRQDCGERGRRPADLRSDPVGRWHRRQ